MKVFTVGLDQKGPTNPTPSGKDSSSIDNQHQQDKSTMGVDSPPPMYAAAANLPLPPPMAIAPSSATYMVRKSRGYKGILMVMLAVFLMAVFALTLSEMAYNRHREENYFRLRWAELKHRLGYGRDRFRQHQSIGGPFDYYGRNSAYGSDRFLGGNKNRQLADALSLQSEPSPSTTTSTTPSPPPSTSTSNLVDGQLPPFFQQRPVDPSALIRDARLRFLKNILQRIKQRAEAMGFDGTMQVSVIEVEPQVIDSGNSNGDSSAQKQQPPPPPSPPFFSNSRPDPKSSAFLDGFGEIHQPSLFQQNQFIEQQQQKGAATAEQAPWSSEQQQHQHQNAAGDFGSGGGVGAADNGFFRPEWRMISPHQPPHIQLQRPPMAFDRWSSASSSGAGVQDGPINNQQQQQQQGGDDQQAPPTPPSSLPMMLPLFPGQQPPPQQGQQVEVNGQPSQEVVGEIYGRKFGRMLQDIISNRIAGFQQQLNNNNNNNGGQNLIAQKVIN